MILFNANVAVPKHIIEAIGNEIKNTLMRDLHGDPRFEMLQDDLRVIEHKLENAIFSFASSQEKSCEGWSLEKHQAEAVANELRLDRKIMAIKEFRTYTGAGLRDSKLFLDKFGMGEVGAMEFLAVFV
jgi:hypothetical protein